MKGYRVWARPAKGDMDACVIYERFKGRDDAEGYYAELQKDGGDIDGCGIREICIGLERYRGGRWEIIGRKLVITE